MGKPIREKTVFVLGAGAHIPYGFPSGYELRNALLDTTWIENNSLNIESNEFFHFRDQHKDFTQQFKHSKCLSIDAFIETRREFAGHATLLLMWILLAKEKHYRLSANPSTDWFEYLWYALNCAPQLFIEHEVTFLTFNYDRLLEHMMAMALAHSHNISYKDASQLIEQKNMVVHLHGSLSPLPTSKSINSTDDQLLFGHHEPTYELLKHLSQNRPVRFYWENHDELPEWKHATATIHKASKIYVLGVGSAVKPLRNLWKEGPSQVERPARIYASVKGLRLAQIAAIRSALTYKNPPPYFHVALGEFLPSISPQDGCYEVLGDYFDVNA